MRALSVLAVCVLGLVGQEPPHTGPATEKRFPPLQVPAGFKATLFACDPLIEYPSVIAEGPRPGSLFVAIDYMTGLGTKIVKRDEIRLVEDTDGDGYADKATVFASGFNSIQGLAYHDGALYVMHAPFLTVLRDTDGDGKADERKDLLSGLGLKPEDNPTRLHCANGVVVGHDGWLYLALGDNGCNVVRPEGDRLILNGGGILRCRPDGRDLHVFASGLRNIYDVALDEDLNVFVRDNENDGGTYMIRVCHSFFGADHGYPYLYYERPDEALPPLADLGLGSSAGGVCYRETAFPAEYRGNLFFCEWGRAVMRYRPERKGSGFAPLKEIEFAAGAPKDPYGFKPTDLVVQRDGSMMISDWGDGQQPKRGRGRIYRITSTDAKAKADDKKPGADVKSRLAQLDSESHWRRVEAQRLLDRGGDTVMKAVAAALKERTIGTRGRLHAIWVLARKEGPPLIADLLAVAKADPEPRVRAQAVRAIADLADPVLVLHRLDAGRGRVKLAARLAELGQDPDPRVVREIVIALGRLRWTEAPAWLGKHLAEPDNALAHAAMQTLRRADNWPAVLKLLDQESAKPIRAVALRALADQGDVTVVDGLIERLKAEPDAARRREYADALTRVYKKPGPWKYWGYRPPPRPANTETWDRTDAIATALDRALADPDRAVRLAVLRRMQREKIPTQPATLGRWLQDEQDSERVAAVLDALRAHPAPAIRAELVKVVTEKKQTAKNRQAALALLMTGLDEASEGRLLTLAETLEDGPILAEALRQLGKRPRLKATALLLDKLKTGEAVVRAAAIEALADLKVQDAVEPLQKLLLDKDAGVRAAAAEAAGKLDVREAAGSLLKLAKDAEPGVRRASLDALRRLREARVVPLAVAALNDAQTQAVALHCLADLGGLEQTAVLVNLAENNPSAEVLPLVVATVSKWMREAEVAKRPAMEAVLAYLQGTSGVAARWHISEPLSPKAATALIADLQLPKRVADLGPPPKWQSVVGAGLEARVLLPPAKDVADDAVRLAVSDILFRENSKVQFLASSNGPLRIWLNGELVHENKKPRPFVLDSDRFDAALSKGPNRLLIQVSPVKGQAEFHLRFRRKSATANHEQLTQAALTRPGNAERGRKLFLNVAKSQCLKCHRLGDQGERIGPDLTGIGGRFSRIHLIESILEPSRAIAPAYQTFVISLNDGRSLTGIKVADDGDALTLADNQGKKHQFKKADIEKEQPHAVSTMPEGLERELSIEEFVDLIGFLGSQKEKRLP